jgi:hypothetical protein
MAVTDKTFTFVRCYQNMQSMFDFLEHFFKSHVSHHVRFFMLLDYSTATPLTNGSPAVFVVSHLGKSSPDPVAASITGDQIGMLADAAIISTTFADESMTPSFI